jgi:membrane-bound inhibitor of C-type lysozyme
MRVCAYAGGMFVLLASAAAWATEVQSLRYQCDRGVQIPATYVTAPDAAIVVLFAEGSQITLHQEPAASGVRYGWPSGGSSYVWLTKGDTATLLWLDGTNQAETVVVAGCSVRP